MNLGKLAMLCVMAISMIGLVACGGTVTIANDTCESFAENETLIKLLETEKHTFTGEITRPYKVMRINQIKLISHEDDGMYCEGIVKFDNAEKLDIEFHRYLDEDGDHFIGYSSK